LYFKIRHELRHTQILAVEDLQTTDGLDITTNSQKEKKSYTRKSLRTTVRI